MPEKEASWHSPQSGRERSLVITSRDETFMDFGGNDFAGVSTQSEMVGYLIRKTGIHKHAHAEYGVWRTQKSWQRQGAHPSPSLPRDSIFLVRAQIRHPSPILSRRRRAVVTLGPTVREAVEEVGSSDGDEGRGVRSADPLGLLVLDCCCDASECKWERWKTCPHAKPMRISFSVHNTKY